MFGCSGKCQLWMNSNPAYQHKHLTPTVKHGSGGVMIWGCFARQVLGNLNGLNQIFEDKWAIFLSSIMYKTDNIMKENMLKKFKKVKVQLQIS